MNQRKQKKLQIEKKNATRNFWEFEKLWKKQTKNEIMAEGWRPLKTYEHKTLDDCRLTNSREKKY